MKPMLSCDSHTIDAHLFLDQPISNQQDQQPDENLVNFEAIRATELSTEPMDLDLTRDPTPIYPSSLTDVNSIFDSTSKTDGSSHFDEISVDSASKMDGPDDSNENLVGFCPLKTDLPSCSDDNVVVDAASKSDGPGNSNENNFDPKWKKDRPCVSIQYQSTDESFKTFSHSVSYHFLSPIVRSLGKEIQPNSTPGRKSIVPILKKVRIVKKLVHSTPKVKVFFCERNDKDDVSSPDVE